MPMEHSQSLARRAALAVALTLGFYLLALAMVSLLLFVPYAEWTYAGRLHLKLALVCVVAAGVIAWSIIPRIDRFTLLHNGGTCRVQEHQDAVQLRSPRD